LFYNSFIHAQSELNLVNMAWKSGQQIGALTQHVLHI